MRCDGWPALNAVAREERHINERKTKSAKTTILMCPLRHLNATPGNEEDERCEGRDGTSKLRSTRSCLADYVTTLVLPGAVVLYRMRTTNTARCTGFNQQSPHHRMAWL